jgi:hypothetical protein
MLNAKRGVILALVGLLAGHYAYLHDLLNGGHRIWMGPVTWTVAAVSFVVASYGLWLIWRKIMDEPT